MSYQINLGQWKSVFAVPSSVVDQHIKIASEAQLKVLLYLLRRSDDENSAEQIGEALRLSAEEVQNAVDFWIERDLLTKQDNTLVPCSAPQPVSHDTPVEKAEPAKKPHTTISRARRHRGRRSRIGRCGSDRTSCRTSRSRIRPRATCHHRPDTCPSADPIARTGRTSRLRCSNGSSIPRQSDRQSGPQSRDPRGRDPPDTLRATWCPSV